MKRNPVLQVHIKKKQGCSDAALGKIDRFICSWNFARWVRKKEHDSREFKILVCYVEITHSYVLIHTY